MLKKDLVAGQVVVYVVSGVSYLGRLESGFKHHLKLRTENGLTGNIKDNKKRGNPTCSLGMKNGKSLPTIEIVDWAEELEVVE